LIKTFDFRIKKEVGKKIMSQSTSPRKSSHGPKLSREKYFQNKIYRTPPTPPLEKQYKMERSFTLDSIAVGNISLDYSKANPKLGSVIPPYDSYNDSAVSNYFNSYGIKELLKKTNQREDNHESIAGHIHDKFQSSGTGYRYLSKRNQNGNGHHPETVDGHRRFLNDEMRVMISYNNMYGFRRNIPKLRNKPTSFTVNPHSYDRLVKSYGAQFDSPEELDEHFYNTYLIGYPFWNNNYNDFHPTVEYLITVKTGMNSPETYDGNIGINIISRNFDTGFIKLDKNIVYKSSQNKKEKKSSKRNDKEEKDQNKEDKEQNKEEKDQNKEDKDQNKEKKDQNNEEKGKNKEEKDKLFKRGKTDIFKFEEQDIRTVNKNLKKNPNVSF
jgi:hypothetical protein